MFKRGDTYKFSKINKQDLKLLPKSKLEAKSKGLKYYYNEKTCLNGHNYIYYTNGGCALCYFDKYFKNDQNLKKERLANLNKIIQIVIEFEVKKDKKFSKELLSFPKNIQEAKKEKTNFFFERKPCINKGHFSERHIVESNRKKGQYKSSCTMCMDMWSEENHEKVIDYGRKYHERNKESRLKKSRERRRKKDFRDKRNNQRRERYKKDINYRIEQRLRARVRKLLDGYSKSKSTMDLIGCDLEFLKKYLEKKFKKGMSWNNNNLWHIDHIRPCSLFDLSKPEEQKKCFNYKNLQPLWANENLSKGGTNRIFYKKLLINKREQS